MLSDSKRVAIVGVAKNCGKTTTMNTLLEFSRGQGRIPGLLSIGIDGETADVLIGTPKPPIHVEPGDWIVTAERALETGTAHVEYVERLGIETPLGDTVIATVIEAGDVVLAGLRHRADYVLACERLEACGADLVFIDGAYGRVMGAHSSVADSAVVSTGAVMSPRIDRIVEKTQAMVDRLQCEAIDEDWQRALIETAIAEDRVLFGGPDIDPIELPSRSALLGLPKARRMWTSKVRAVAVPGLVSDRVIEELLYKGGSKRTLLVPDGTVLQASPRLTKKFEKRWKIRALAWVAVKGISVNPTSPQGYVVDERALIDSMRVLWPEITIFNPHHGIES